MSGHRHIMDAVGGSYEDSAALLVGRIASVVTVPRNKDYGIDLYCQPRVPIGPKTETVAELCGIQVKGGRAALAYGGLDRRGEWKGYEFSWLQSLATPLYLAQVSADFSSVDLFSTWPIWYAIWWRGIPYKVVFVTRPPCTTPHDWRHEALQMAPDPAGVGHGNGMKLTIDLGPPFLRLTNESLSDPAFQARAVMILHTWIARDRLTLMRAHQSLPVVAFPERWQTNSLDGVVEGIAYFWNSNEGRNIASLCNTLAPGLVNLCLHLKDQRNDAVYRFLPALEWLADQQSLDMLGQGLLADLRAMLASSRSPDVTI